MLLKHYDSEMGLHCYFGSPLHLLVLHLLSQPFIAWITESFCGQKGSKRISFPDTYTQKPSAEWHLKKEPLFIFKQWTYYFSNKAQPLGHFRPFFVIWIRCSLRHNINPIIIKMIYCTINILKSLKASDLSLQHWLCWLIKQNTVVNGYCKHFYLRTQL